MMDTRNETDKGFTGLFGSVLGRIRENVNIDLACGASRTVGDTTIIPIGVVSYGFGFGIGTQPNADSQGTQEGGGGGGGAWIQPVAIVTITNGKTKVIPVLDLARVIPAMIGAVGKLALSGRARGRSVFGPGSMTVLSGKGKRAHRHSNENEDTTDKEA